MRSPRPLPTKAQIAILCLGVGIDLAFGALTSPRARAEPPRIQASTATGTTEQGLAAGVIASFEFPENTDIDLTALMGSGLLRLHVGTEVLPVQIVRREIKGRNGHLKYGLSFVPQGELHIDAAAFNQLADLHAFVTPAMESSIEYGNTVLQATVKFAISPAGMGIIHTDEGNIVTVGAQSNLGFSVLFHINDRQSAEGGAEASLFRNWHGDPIKAVDFDGYLRYSFKITDKPNPGSVISSFYAGPVLSLERMEVYDSNGQLLDSDHKGFTGLALGVTLW